MFGTEFTVEIELPGHETITLFVDKSLVRKQNGKEFLEVDLVDKIGGAEGTFLLPTESFEKQTRWFRFPVVDLQPA